MRFTTILSILAVAYSVQALAVPTQRSGPQPHSKSSMVEPQVESSSHQNDKHNQSPVSITQDHTSSEENSPMDSADRIRKIVQAALAARRATSPRPRTRFRIRSNNKKTVGLETTESSTVKSDIVTHSTESMIQTHDVNQSKHPVKSSKHMIRRNNTPSNIRKPHIVFNGNDHNKRNKASNRESKSALAMINTQLPVTNTKIKSHQNIAIMPSSRTFSKLSDPESPVSAIPLKSMPSPQRKYEIISNRNNDFKPKISDLSTTPDTMSVSKLHKTPSAEGSSSDESEEYPNLKFVSPWAKITEAGRNSQLDAIRKLIGRQVLPFNSKVTEGSYETLSTTQYGSMGRSTSSISLNKNVDKDMSSSERKQLYRNKETAIPNIRKTMQPNLKSFNDVELKIDTLEREESTMLPTLMNKNNVNLKLFSTSGVHIPTKMIFDMNDPIHMMEISKTLDQIQPTISAIAKANLAPKQNEQEQALDQIQPTISAIAKARLASKQIEQEQALDHFQPTIDAMAKARLAPKQKEREQALDQIQPAISAIAKAHLEPKQIEQEQALDHFQPTIDAIAKARLAPKQKEQEQALDHFQPTIDAIAMARLAPKQKEREQALDQIQPTISAIAKARLAPKQREGEHVKETTTDYSDINESLIGADLTEDIKTLDYSQPRITEHVLDMTDIETKKATINEALDDYSDIIGSLVDYYDLNEPEEEPSEPRDLSAMIVDLFFKVTG